MTIKSEVMYKCPIIYKMADKEVSCAADLETMKSKVM